MRYLLFVALVGCATAGTEQPSTGTDAATDGKLVDAAPDAPPPCTEIMTELLMNPAFDGTPTGTAWTQMPGDPSFPLITSAGQTGGPNGGITEQTAPNDAWLGGLVNITDVLYQDVMVPARTRLILLSGFYEVRTGETVATPVDLATFEWVTPGNAPIATISSLDNTKKTTAWTTVNYGISNAPMYSGMTIRLKLTATNSASAPTSFFFDTLSVKATHCMP